VRACVCVGGGGYLTQHGCHIEQLLSVGRGLPQDYLDAFD
jgi:hypothetical protein